MRRHVLSMILVALVAATALGAERLSLEEAMERAREASREAVAARLRLEAAEEEQRRARGFRLPTLSFEESFIRTDSPAEVFALTLNQGRFSFADLVRGDPNHPAPRNAAVSRLELAVPVYTGGELAGRVGQAEAAVQAAAAHAAWAADRAALAAAEAYVAVAQAREYLALVQRSRDTVAAHVALAQAYVEQGMLVRSELLRAEVELARVDDLLAEAQGAVRVAMANLAFRLGADQNGEWELEPLGEPPAMVEDLAAWLASTASRRDLLAARAMLQAGRLEERVRRAAMLPKVAVIGRRDWVDDSPFGRGADASSVMAVARMRLAGGGSDRAAARAARFAAEAAARELEQFEEGVALEVRQAFEAARTEGLRHATARRALAAAVEGERITRERFASGVVRMLDLLDASTARREAETRELLARARAIEAALRLAVASGRSPESVLR